MLIPSPQGPIGRPVDTGIWVVAVEVEELAGQRLLVTRVQSVGSKRPRARMTERRIEVSRSKRMAFISELAVN